MIKKIQELRMNQWPKMLMMEMTRRKMKDKLMVRDKMKAKKKKRRKRKKM